MPDRGTPYTPLTGGSFDLNPLDFGADNFSGTPWERGNSAIAGKNGTNSGTSAWVTGLTNTTYSDNADVRLMTPNYNFTAAGTYLVKLYRKNSFEIGYDGFRLEYSFDKGSNWFPIGAVGGTWYDFANGGGGTAFPVNEPFFNNIKAAYTLCQYDVSALAGNANVAFRLRFASDGSVGSAGVAVDDFEITGPNNIPLPVSLIYFTGKPLEKFNSLTWATASESINKGFAVEGSADKNIFEEIGFVQGNGTTNTTNYYSFDDADVKDGTTTYYRLKQIDLNGKENFSKIISVTRRNEKIKIILSPNPVKDILTINNLSAEKSHVRIFNAQGKVVFDKTFFNSDGTISFNVADANLSDGVYFISVEDGTTEFFERLLKL